MRLGCHTSFSGWNNFRHVGRLLGLGLLLLSSASSAMYTSTQPARFKNGYVLARSVVLDANKQPILVEYNSEGKEVRKLSLNVPTSSVYVIPANEYRSQLQVLQQFKQEHANDLAKDAQLLNRTQFEKGEFLAADNKTKIKQNTLPLNVKSVLVRSQANRILPDPNQLVLLTFTLDHTQSNLVVANDAVSLVVDTQGRIIEQGRNAIAPRTGFVGDGENPKAGGMITPGKDKLYGPMADTYVSLTNPPWLGADITNKDGRYSFVYLLPPCPLGGFEFTTDVWARLNYQGFTPRGSAVRPYYLRHPGYDYCMASYVPDGTLIGAMTDVALIGIYATMATPMVQSNFYVDVMFLSGQMKLRNPDGSIVPVAENTEYHYQAPDLKAITQTQYDFDQDGKPDVSKLGSMKQVDDNGKKVTRFVSELPEGEKPEYQGVYFSSRSDKTGDPDLLRVPDTAQLQTANGWLSSISKEDLKNTDILVFRDATGELVLERKGIRDTELRDVGVSDDAQSIYYRLMLRGPRDTGQSAFAMGQSWENWSSRYKLTAPYQKRNANHLKAGEFVTVVAINRATGYMASQTVPLKAASDNNNQLLNVPVGELSLMPPNLKIWAERNYKVQSGLTKDEKRHYLIGSEGAAMSSDSDVTVYSEWLTQDGRALPLGLGADRGEQYGLTGRLAKVVAPDMLAGVSDGGLANFPIPPGRSTQVVKVADNLSKSEHYYLHVSGTAKDENPSFETGGASKAPLNTRPAKLTPFMTPFYDETNSWVEYNAYRKLKSDYYEAEDKSGVIKPLKPIAGYGWQYRPEYQFSRYDLQMKQIKASAVESGGTRVPNMLEQKTPALTSLDDLVELFYSLNVPKNPRLSNLDNGQDLVFALGESEVKANLKADGSVSFDKQSLAHLTSLQPEDFLTLRLYTNQDAGNVLWEYAFEYLAVHTRKEGFDMEDDDGTTYVSADDPMVPLQSILVGYAERDPKFKKPVKVVWQASIGYFDNMSQEYKDLGIFPADLHLPNIAGTRSVVRLTLGDSSETTAKLAPFVVIPGKPAVMTPKVVGEEIYIEGHKSLELSVEVRDAHGNLVADGTPVSFTLDGQATFASQDLATKGGMAKAVIRGVAMPSAENSVTVKVGSLSYNHPFVVKPLHPEFISVPLEFQPEEQHDIQVQVTDDHGELVPNVAVNFSASFGRFGSEITMTGSDGIATGHFHTGYAPIKDGKVMARVGLVPATYKKTTVKPKDKAVDMGMATLIGDATERGQAQYQRYDGLNMQLQYEAEAPIKVNTEKDRRYTLQLGSLAEPNLAPLAAYYMNDLDSDAEGNALAIEETGLHGGKSLLVTKIQDDPSGVGNSYGFNRLAGKDSEGNPISSWIRVPASAALRPEKSLGFRLDIKPQELGGTLFTLGGSHSLQLGEDGKLLFTVYTDEGPLTLTSAPITPGKWHTVAGRYLKGQLELEVDGVASTPVSGGQTLSYTVTETGIEIGRGVTGYLNSLRFYDWSSAPLITFSDGSLTQHLVGDGAEHDLLIKSSGQLNSLQADSQLRMLKLVLIARHEGDKPEQYRHFVGVLSKAFYAEVMGHYYENNKSDSLPPIDISRLNNPAVPFMSVAYAGWTDWVIEGAFEAAKLVLGSIIPYEDFVGLWNQLNYWVDDDKRFDPMELAFNALGVVTVVPVLKPLKLILQPLKRVLVPLRKSKFIRSMGSIVGKLADEALHGKYDKFIDLMPMLITAYEMASDAEARKGLMTMVDAISSADDFYAWVDFLKLPADGWDGDVIPPLNLTSNGPSHYSSWGVLSEAYAKGGKKNKFKIEGGKLGTYIGEIKEEVLGENKEAAKLLTIEVKTIGRSVKELSGPEAEAIRSSIFSKLVLKGALNVVKDCGAAPLANLLRAGKDQIRMPVILPIAAIAYLESRMTPSACGKIKGCEGITVSKLQVQIRTLYAKALSDVFTGASAHMNANNQKGALFQLVVIAAKQLTHEAVNTGALVAVEEEEHVQLWTYAGGEMRKAGLPLERNVDIEVANDKDQKPIWVETKSLAGPFTDGGSGLDAIRSRKWDPWSYSRYNELLAKKEASKSGKGESTTPGRQWMLDRIASTNNTYLTKDQKSEGQLASRFEWWLHDFKLPPSKQNPAGIRSFTKPEWVSLRKRLTPELSSLDPEIINSLGYLTAKQNPIKWNNDVLHANKFNSRVREGCYIKPFNIKTYLFKDPEIRERLFEGIASELVELFFKIEADQDEEIKVELDLEC